MKKNIRNTILGAIAIIAVVSFAKVFALSSEQSYYLNATQSTYFDINNTNSSLTNITSSLNVTSFLATSGGDGSYCSWCHVTETISKKGFLGIYSKLASKSINTTGVGNYTGPSSSKGGSGTFRLTVKNEDHTIDGGTYKINMTN